MKGHSKQNGDQVKSLMREVRALRREIQNAQPARAGGSKIHAATTKKFLSGSGIQNRIEDRSSIDRAVALADREVGIPAPAPYGAGPGYGIAPAPIVAVPEPAPPGPPTPAWLERGGTASFGVSGTPITSGFLVDLGEYNPELMGVNGVRTYEKMRRGDGQVRATLAACKLPVLSAKWDVVAAEPKIETGNSKLGRFSNFDFRVSSTGEGKQTQAKAKEVAAFVRENLFGGLEFRTSTGGWATERWDEVIQNALLMLEFGCAVHEDVWTVDGSRLRLRKLAARLPLTFYRWHTEEDGETLLAIEQWGYRGNQFKNVLLPADKCAVFTYQQEGANFWGIPVTRAMYPHWYIKNQLYRIDAIACERNALGVPTWRLAPGFSKEDHDAAYNFVTQLAAHESTGVVEPPGDQNTGFRIVGYQGRLRDVLPTIEHHNEQISTAALAMFLNLGRTATGSRALGKEHTDFFMLALQTLADQIAVKISTSTIRRLVYFNFGEDAPCPRLVAANVQSRTLEDIVDSLTKFAQAGLVISEMNIRKFIREELALPEESKEAVVAIRGETVDEGNGAAVVSGKGAGLAPYGGGAEPVEEGESGQRSKVR